MTKDKRTLLIIVGVMLLAVSILAAGLTDMQMTMGDFFGAAEPTLEGGIFGAGMGSASFNPLLIQLVTILLIIAIPTGVIMMFIDPDMRRKVLRDALFLALLTAAMLFILQRNPSMSQLIGALEPPPGPVSESQDVEMPEDLTVTTPSWAVWAASGLVLLVGGVILWVATQSAEPPMEPTGVLEELRLRSTEAAERLQAGDSLREVIIQYYMSMHDTLANYRGVTNSDRLTPREFEQRMMAATGLPRESISRLTRLFERVRYGAYEATEADKDEASACLDTINKALA